jgi:hypothetical protein
MIYNVRVLVVISAVTQFNLSSLVVGVALQRSENAPL